MNLKKVISLIALLFMVVQLKGEPLVDNKVTIDNEEIILPDVPNKTSEIEANLGWNLIKNYTAVLETKLNVFVPLEILNDIDIDTVILDNEELKIPFEIEFNKIPDRKEYYKLKFSETEIDIDNDGRIDTTIYSSKYINKKIIQDNYIQIKGKNISKDGDYYKKVYITIDIDE